MARPRYTPSPGIVRLLLVAGALLFGGALAHSDPAGRTAPGVRLTAEEQRWLRAHPVIRLAPDPEFKPIEYFDEQGVYRGAAADTIHLLEQKLGIRITVVRHADWDAVHDAFVRHEVDLLGALVRTPGREDYALFSETLLTVPGGIFTRSGSGEPLTLEALAGKKVAVVSNYTSHEVLRDQYPQIRLEVVPDVLTGLAKASLGMVDAYVENMASATYYSQQAGVTNLRLAGTTPFDYRWSIGIRKDWPELQGILDKGLTAISPAERQQVLGRWIAVSGAAWRPSWAFILGMLALLLGLLSAVVLIWNTTLQRTRHKALANEQKFRALFHNISDPVYLHDGGGRFLGANEQALAELGYSEAELLSLQIRDIDPAADSQRQQEGLLALHRDRLKFETQHRRRDGSTYPVEVNCRLLDVDGQQVVLGVARNLTERKLAEERLRRSERLNRAMNRIAKAFLLGESEGASFRETLRAILDATDSPLGLVGYLDEGGKLVCPARTSSPVPLPATAGLAFPGGAEFPPSAWADHCWGAALRGSEALLCDAPWPATDGSAAIVRSLSVPLAYSGQAIGLLSVANKSSGYTGDDLDTLQRIGEQLSPIVQAQLAQRAADRALQEQIGRLRLYFERMPLGCIVWSAEARVVSWNPAAETIFEYPEAEAVGRTAQELIVPTDDSQRVDELLRALADRRRHTPVVAVNRSRSGRAVRCRWTDTVLYDAGGQTVGVLSMIEDITEQTRKQEEHRRLEQQMMHTQKLESLGVLAGGIAHDFNNILMSILGNADLALMRLHPESPVADNLRTIEQAAARAADLAKQMLAYSGKGKFFVEPLELNRLVEEMTHMLGVSISKKAILRFNLAKQLPSVNADATQLRQIIMNLVINASEAIGDRSGVIALSTGCMDCDSSYLRDIWLDEQLPSGLYVYLEVMDTGCGMASETMNKIFDPFFTTKFTGRGLGLAAVLGIVRGHRGAIKVYSEQGRGTTFKILLPAGGQPVPQPEPGTGPGEVQGEGTVLLVDDEETIRAIGAQMLRILGFEVTCASDGREAIELYRQRRHFDLVVLDLTMPHLDGEQTFRELRRLDPGVRVVMSSGYGEQEVTERFLGKGLAGFIQKPYGLTALRAALQASGVLRGGEGSRRD